MNHHHHHRNRPHAFAGRRSRVYDLVARRLLRGVYRRLAADVAESTPDGATVLDIGTGPGVLLAELARRRPDLTLIGVDLSADMVSAAARNLAPFGARASVEQADVAELPFADGSVDVVVSSLSLHHWDRPREAIGELRRVAATGRSTTDLRLPVRPVRRGRVGVLGPVAVLRCRARAHPAGGAHPVPPALSPAHPDGVTDRARTSFDGLRRAAFPRVGHRFESFDVVEVPALGYDVAAGGGFSASAAPRRCTPRLGDQQVAQSTAQRLRPASGGGAAIMLARRITVFSPLVIRPYSAIVTRPARSALGSGVADTFVADPYAAVFRVLQKASTASTATAIKEVLRSAGVAKNDADQAWPRVQRRLKSHDHVVVSGSGQEMTYRWTPQPAEPTASEALNLLATGQLRADRRQALVDIVRNAARPRRRSRRRRAT